MPNYARLRERRVRHQEIPHPRCLLLGLMSSVDLFALRCSKPRHVLPPAHACSFWHLFSPSFLCLVSCFVLVVRSTIRVWETQTWGCEKLLEDHAGPVYALTVLEGKLVRKRRCCLKLLLEALW